MLTRDISPDRKDRGFTAIEMAVVLGILSLVMAVLGNVLMSVTHAATQGEALVANEQASTLALTQLARDLRAADPITYDPTITSTAPYQSKVQMTLVDPAIVVQWRFDPNTQTLYREIMSGVNGTVTSSNPMLRLVLNSSTQPVFSYYSEKGIDMVAAGSPQSLAVCTSLVKVYLVSRSDPGPLPFTETKSIELRNQLSIQHNNPTVQC